MKEFKRKLNDPESEKPLILVYLHNKIFETLYKMMKPVFDNYEEVFDIYVCDDAKVAKQYMDISQTPYVFPKMVIFDPTNSKRQPVRHLKDQQDLEKRLQEVGDKVPASINDSISEHAGLNKNNSHMFKSNHYFIMPDQKLATKTTKWIEKFLDDTLDHSHMSQKRENCPSLVRTQNFDQFDKDFVNDSQKREVIIEIYKDHCGACQYASKIFDALSYKFEKHGYDIPMVRLKIENNVPYFGQTPYSPMYIYVRKGEGNAIAEVKTLNGPLRGGQKFVEEIEESLKIEGLGNRIRIHNQAQMQAWYSG